MNHDERCPTLRDLPPPPPGKTGWPWTVETPPLDDGDAALLTQWPRISVITPNYNYGAFLEETLRSVLLQSYPNLELIVVDGQSKDDSVEIIRKYEPWITRWVSEPDGGQAAAINKGFGWATGTVCNWLNSDDILMPGAVRFVGEVFAIGELDWLGGGRLLKQPSGIVLEVQLPWLTHWPGFALGIPDFPQEATFFSKRIWDRVGGLDTSYDCVFDVDFFHRVLRATHAGALTRFPVGAMNSHAGQKTLRALSGAEYQRLESVMFAGPLRYVVKRLTYSRLGNALLAGMRLAMRPHARRYYRIAHRDPLSGRVILRPLEGV
jgi:glycosyltransferase involved in cell wall biosynthesis